MNEVELALLRRPELTGPHKVLLLWLWHDQSTQPFLIQLNRLAQETGLPDRTLRRTLKELIELGAIVLEQDKPRLIGRIDLDRIMRGTLGSHEWHTSCRAAKVATYPGSQQSHGEPSPTTNQQLSGSGSTGTELAISTTGLNYPKKPYDPGIEKKLRWGEGAGRGGDFSATPGPGGRSPAAPPRPPKKMERVRCPANFWPSPDTEARVRASFPRVAIELEIAKFVAHFTEGRGASEKRPGWDRSFIAWCAQAQAWADQRSHGSDRPAAPAAPFGAGASGRSSRPTGHATSTDWLRDRLDDAGPTIDGEDWT